LLSLVYGLAVSVIAGFYLIRPRRLGCKVISVGNITLGGTGKTSLVECLAVKLALKGRKVAVLSRGYGMRSGGAGCRIADEPAMLQNNLPQARVLVDKDRIRSASSAVRDYGADTVVLDDGMQQWRIFKDLEIISIDSRDPFGNMRLIPAGFLREPLWVLKRADSFVLTQVGTGQDTLPLTLKLKKINPRALIAESRHAFESFVSLDKPGQVLGADAFKGKKALIFSGIGNPLAFEDTVRSLGIDAAETLRFDDHHAYTQADIDAVIRRAGDMGAEAIITTEKDAVKISRLKISRPGVFSLRIKLKITKNEAEFDRRLSELFGF